MSSNVKDGENEIVSKLQLRWNERRQNTQIHMQNIGQEVKPSSFSGITGEVRLLKHENEM